VPGGCHGRNVLQGEEIGLDIDDAPLLSPSSVTLAARRGIQAPLRTNVVTMRMKHAHGKGHAPG
jgi:hypothetical protein